MHLLHHLLANSALKYPDSTAVISRDRSITYSGLEMKSNQLSQMLSVKGVKKGDRVGILLGKSIESIAALFGILKTGAIYVPMDPAAPVARNRHILNHCGVSCLIASYENWQNLSSPSGDGLTVRTVLLTDMQADETVNGGQAVEYAAWNELEALPSDCAPPHLCDVTPAYILHTSGSTGMPKGVVLSHLNALTFVHMACDFFHFSNRDRVGNHAPLHFDLSVFDIFGGVKSGATVVLVPEFLSTFPVQLAEFIDRQRISIWNSVASVLAILAEKGQLDRFSFGSLRLVHFSGDIMPVKYLRKLRNNMPNAVFYNIYGQTEANSSLSYRVNDVGSDDVRKIPAGKPLPNFEVFAIDDGGNVVEASGGEGELHVSSSTVATGYWGDGEKTREKFVPDPRNNHAHARVYKTGDIVRLDDEGNYVFVGRKDNMIKSRGYRIELDEIELVLYNHPLIQQAAAVAVPDDLIGNKIVAYLSLAKGHTLTDDDLIRHCGTALPHYMIPETFKIRDVLPKTSTGKIDRNALKQQSL